MLRSGFLDPAAYNVVECWGLMVSILLLDERLKHVANVKFLSFVIPQEKSWLLENLFDMGSHVKQLNVLSTPVRSKLYTCYGISL